MIMDKADKSRITGIEPPLPRDDEPVTHETSTLDGGAGETNRRSLRRGGLVLLLLILALGGWIAVRVRAATGKQKAVAAERQQVASQAAAVAARPPEARTIVGEPATILPEIRFEGTLSPVREADLAFKAAGRIETLRVKVGDRVRAGTVLGTLDAREANAQLAAAQAQLAAAEAQLALASDADRRTETVVSSGAGPEVAGVQARQQKALAEAQREAARAQVALAETARANHTLTAPFTGTVSRVPSGPGGVVAPGVPQFHLADYDTLKLVGTVSAGDARLVRMGAAVKIKREARGKGQATEAAGKVIALVAALDPATKRVPVEAQIVNDRADPLLAGTLVRAQIATAQPIRALRLPGEVLRPGSADEIVVVGPGDRLEVRSVEVEIAADGALFVRSGVEPGERVLARPWPEAKSGDRVTVAAMAPEGREQGQGQPSQQPQGTPQNQVEPLVPEGRGSR